MMKNTMWVFIILIINIIIVLYYIIRTVSVVWCGAALAPHIKTNQNLAYFFFFCFCLEIVKTREPDKHTPLGDFPHSKICYCAFRSSTD